MVFKISFKQFIHSNFVRNCAMCESKMLCLLRLTPRSNYNMPDLPKQKSVNNLMEGGCEEERGEVKFTIHY